MRCTIKQSRAFTRRRPGWVARTVNPVLATTAFLILSVPVARSEEQTASNALFETIAALDAKVFAAFNQCDSPERLDEYAGHFAPDVEFYHDTAGVTRTREAMIAGTRENVCGHFRRERVPGTLEVFPIKGFGAIARGEHRFCRGDADHCPSRANFVIIWRREQNEWRITRVLSFAHRPDKQSP